MANCSLECNDVIAYLCGFCSVCQQKHCAERPLQHIYAQVKHVPGHSNDAKQSFLLCFLQMDHVVYSLYHTYAKKKGNCIDGYHWLSVVITTSKKSGDDSNYHLLLVPNFF